MADIFVSYASPDREVAFRIVAFLEEHGISCWVAPRDVPPGVEYAQAIIDGIGQSRALVLILSDQANESQFVKKEVERAVSKTKPVLPVRIREVTPSGSLEFFISSAQWVDAWKSPMEQHLLPLVEAIKAMGQPGAAPVRSSALPSRRRSIAPMLAGIAVLAVLGVAGAWWYATKTAQPIAPTVTAPPTPAVTAPPAAVEPAPPAIAPAPVAKAPAAPEAKATAVPDGPKRNDVAFVTGSWCQPYHGKMIRYNIIRTGPDTILTQVDHPQSPNWEVSTRVVPVKGGFEFRPIDKEADAKDVSRFEIVDDTTMKLAHAQGEAQEGIIRTRCPAK